MARQCLANRSTLGESERTLNCLMVYLNLPPGVTTKQMKLKLQSISREAEVLRGLRLGGRDSVTGMLSGFVRRQAGTDPQPARVANALPRLRAGHPGSP